MRWVRWVRQGDLPHLLAIAAVIASKPARHVGKIRRRLMDVRRTPVARVPVSVRHSPPRTRKPIRRVARSRFPDASSVMTQVHRPAPSLTIHEPRTGYHRICSFRTVILIRLYLWCVGSIPQHWGDSEVFLEVGRLREGKIGNFEGVARGGDRAMRSGACLWAPFRFDLDVYPYLPKATLGACAVEVLMLGDWRTSAGEVRSWPGCGSVARPTLGRKFHAGRPERKGLVFPARSMGTARRGVSGTRVPESIFWTSKAPTTGIIMTRAMLTPQLFAAARHIGHPSGSRTDVRCCGKGIPDYHSS